MAKQYKALQPVGRFQKGDMVGELSEQEHALQVIGHLVQRKGG